MSQPSGERNPRRAGASLSTRQIVEATRRGRQITFKWTASHPGHEVCGYVVGMDDFHWLVAVPGRLNPDPTDAQRKQYEANPYSLSLVHKSVPLTHLHSTPTFDSLDAHAREAIQKIRGAFLDSLATNRETQP